MLDKVIHAHLDNMDALEANLEKDLEKIYGSIDIDAIILDPAAELSEVAQTIEHLLLEKYFPLAIKEGKEFSQSVRDSKKIVVQDSNDPKLNESLADDKRTSQD